VNGKTGNENSKIENQKFVITQFFFQLRDKHWRETFDREILKVVKGEGFDVVDEFLGDPIYAFFFLLLMLNFGIGLCLGTWGFAIP